MSVTTACFGNRIFAEDSATNCVSNLLATGYRRFLVDLYWSSERRQWTFCPVAIPSRDTSRTGPSGARKSTSNASSSGPSVHQQDASLCTDSLELSNFFDIFGDYFQQSTSDLDVHMTYVIFNLHVAANASSPDQPASVVSGTQSPTSSESLGSLISDALGTYIYTRSDLAEDRGNLDKSWFKVPDKYRPITEYFTIHKDDYGNHITPDGWPCSKYVQYASQRRLLVGYGSIDPQLQDYDPTSDDVLFSPGYLTSNIQVSTTDSGLQSGCLYQPGASEVSEVNSSWAEYRPIPYSGSSDISQTLELLSHLVRNSTACGLSPTFNNTLLNTTADNALDWYGNISRAATWSWAVGEPRGANVSGKNSESETHRCALMDMSLTGHWRAANCDEKRLVACRIDDMPFAWTLSDKQVSFSDASDSCPDNSSFSIPRTGLENMYLYHHLLSRSTDTIDPSSDNATKREVWLNYNCRDVLSCWITEGLDASCPYNVDPKELERKTVVVAAVASIIICIITALTLFVKCNANRRNSRKRKKVIRGWDYEGVPS